MTYLLVLGALFIHCILHGFKEACTIQLQPLWHYLDNDARTAQEFDGKWVLIGSITFKKKAKEPVNLTRLYLHWQGEHLPQLLGSLYRKKLDKDFLPIEENLVCDGSWNKGEQTLMLNFDKAEILGPMNIFYLVLTIPESLEPTLKKGRFNIVNYTLPELLKPLIRSDNLYLTLDAIGSSVTH